MSSLLGMAYPDVILRLPTAVSLLEYQRTSRMANENLPFGFAKDGRRLAVRRGAGRSQDGWSDRVGEVAGIWPRRTPALSLGVRLSRQSVGQLPLPVLTLSCA